LEDGETGINLGTVNIMALLFIYSFTTLPHPSLSLSFERGWTWGMFLEMNQSIGGEQKTKNGYAYTMPEM
jgi:hypothetical protein